MAVAAKTKIDPLAYQQRLEKVTNALIQFEETGKISDTLLTGFDQEGQWRGIQGGLTDTKGNWALMVPDSLKKSILSIELRTSQDPEGNIHLRTSYYQDVPKPKINLPENIVVIEGDLVLQRCKEFEAPNLTKIVGGLRGHELKILKTPQLLEVGGSVGIDSLEWQAPKLTILYGCATLGQLERAHFPLLRKVKGDLNINQAHEFYLPALKELVGEIYLAWSQKPQGLKRIASQLSNSCLEDHCQRDGMLHEAASKELNRRKLEEALGQQELILS